MKKNKKNYSNASFSAGGKKRNIKKKGIAIVALILAGVVAVSSALAYVFKKHNNKNTTNENTNSSTSTSSISDIDTTTTLDSLGDSLEFPKQDTNKYGDTTNGVAKKEEIVEKNSDIYVNQGAADKSDNVGKKQTDTKNGTLTVDPNTGKVKDKNNGYVVQDGKTKETLESGNGDKSPNYQYDPGLGKEIEKEEVGKNTYADQDYYGWIGDGTEWGVVIPKGTLIAKEDLERAKKELSTSKFPPKEESTPSKSDTTSIPSTSKPSSSTSSSSSSSTSSSNSSSTIETEEGIINPDGTYTIYDMKFRSKADYEQWVLQGYEGYAIKDGIMMPEEEAKVSMNIAQKVLTR